MLTGEHAISTIKTRSKATEHATICVGHVSFSSSYLPVWRAVALLSAEELEAFSLFWISSLSMVCTHVGDHHFRYDILMLFYQCSTSKSVFLSHD